MEVKCPQCSSRFNLPDGLAKAGAKLRCSVCKTVFPFQPEPRVSGDELPGSDEMPPARKKQRSGRPRLWLAALLLLCIGGGAYWYFAAREAASPLTEQELAKKVELLTMRNVRQYYVDNEKVGKVFVIEGQVVNEFPQPKELIAVEAAIYDKDKKPLAVKKQLAGTQLSLFQLQVLSEKEMESFLNNKVEILSNNTNVPHGGEVPFMVLFYAPPEGVAEFGVKIADVQDIPSPKE
ncbi:zinc-ribbon and DUF3426 domain-containing protein [Desulfovibrio sp. ZJ369]|uniref:zinc-ribbon and DUF3426 domain-containing protein n=2 Tax=unclassified Desulfovibrio TaxID=2593640 RepID=UPI0013EC07B0|nr:zinc-ribbon and DUF3426 domain-containing protein [Desulfovibrio sp. ZJ369]